jgi:hypothetical protein
MGCLHHASHVIRLGHIGFDNKRAIVLASLCCLLGALPDPVGHGDLRTLSRKQHAHRAPIADRGICKATRVLTAANHKNAPARQASTPRSLSL